MTCTYRIPTGLAYRLKIPCSVYLSLIETYPLQKYDLLDFYNGHGLVKLMLIETYYWNYSTFYNGPRESQHGLSYYNFFLNAL